MVRCRQCGVMFDALATLVENESEIKAGDEASPHEALWKTQVPANKSRRWGVGVMVAGALLCVQLAYFESGRLLNNSNIRPAFEALCRLIHCRLPAYRDASALSVLHHEFKELPNRQYIFKLVLNNDSAFSMPYPAIGLTLLSFDGQAFARRVFQPEDYLPQGKAGELLAPHAAADVSLEIAPPKAKAGGFHFDLSY